MSCQRLLWCCRAFCTLLACCWLLEGLYLADSLDPGSPYGSQPNPMGYHEGARRILRCDGGYIKGFDVYMNHDGGFAEPSVDALRVICSTSRLQLEYETGSLPDTLVFGNLPNTIAPTRVECPKGTGVAAMDWRRVPGTEKDNTARIAGVKIHCSSEMSLQPMVVDSKQSMEYPASLKCSGTSNPPQGPKYRLTAIELWHEQVLAGLHLINCESEQ